MSNLAFNEENHTYELDGKRLPSVTQIMKPLYDFSSVNPDVLRRAGEYGTAVHRTIELHLKDDLDESTLDENLLKPLEAFKVWVMDFPEINMETAAIEVPGYHSKLMYAGTPDIDSEGHVIDIKTRPVNFMTDAIQLAAYDHMTGSGKRQRCVLHLQMDGTYIFTRVNGTALKSADAWSRFRYLLDYHKAGKQIEIWRGMK